MKTTLTTRWRFSSPLRRGACASCARSNGGHGQAEICTIPCGTRRPQSFSVRSLGDWQNAIRVRNVVDYANGKDVFRSL